MVRCSEEDDREVGCRRARDGALAGGARCGNGPWASALRMLRCAANKIPVSTPSLVARRGGCYEPGPHMRRNSPFARERALARPPSGRRSGQAHNRIDDAGFLRHHDPHFPRPRRLRDLAAAVGARPEDRARAAAASIPSPAAIPPCGPAGPSAERDNVVRLPGANGGPRPPPRRRRRPSAGRASPSRARRMAAGPRRDRPRPSRPSMPRRSSKAPRPPTR